jgi:hypothetical protein
MMTGTLFSLFCELPLVIEILTEKQNNPRELVTFAAAAPPARAGGLLAIPSEGQAMEPTTRISHEFSPWSLPLRDSKRCERIEERYRVRFLHGPNSNS